MHFNFAKASLLLALPLLGGCQSLFNTQTARTEIRAVQPTGLAAEDAEIYLATGRKALDEGRYAAAVDAYRFARLSPGSEAAAYNGLAIAYSQLGRADLTERFFRRAVALAPGEPRYQRNFAQFVQRRRSPLPLDGPPAVASVTLPEGAPVDPVSEPATTGGLRAGAPVRVEVQVSRLIAAGAGQVMISTRPDDRASAYDVRTQIAPKPARDKYPLKLSFSDPYGGSTQAPVGTLPKGNTYPIRVELMTNER